MDEILALYQELHDSLGTNEICAEFCSEMLGIIQSEVDAIPSGARIGIRCADPCAKYLLEAIDFSRTKVVGVFDLQRTGSFCGYPILPAETLSDAACDYVIFATYLFRDDILQELSAFKGKVIDPYVLLENHGIKLRGPFNFYQLGLPLVLNYFYLNYWEAQDAKQKEVMLQNLLQAAIEYKDFSLIEKLYRECGESSGEYPVLVEVWRKTQILLKTIQDKIKARKQKDILAFWTDAVNYFDLEDMPGLRSKTDEGTFFANAYTTAPWTHSVLKTIFQKSFPIDGFAQTEEMIRRENSPLIQYLESKDYEILWLSSPTWAMDPKYGTSEIKDYMSNTLIWWYGVQSLLKSSRPCFYIFHFIAEGHEPMFSPDLVKFQYYRPVELKKSDQLMEQRRASLAYLDHCLMLYNQVFEGKLQIFFSDHGIYYANLAQWSKERLHVYCLVLGNSVPKQNVQEYFSYINFEELIRWLIEPETYRLTDILRDEVYSQGVDYYSETLVDRAIALYKKGYPRNGIAFRCVRDKKQLYVINALGEEQYFRINEDGTETRTPLEDDSLRAELQSKCGTYFIDVRKYEKFKHSRKLYESVLRDHPELGKPLWLTDET
nr:sulfatase-like hydrolase/transferase [uncultured Oscillibacter sp.]